MVGGGGARLGEGFRKGGELTVHRSAFLSRCNLRDAVATRSGLATRNFVLTWGVGVGQGGVGATGAYSVAAHACHANLICRAV